MVLRIEANAEPIPGYRLIDRLGSGGFGEVWRAEAPGGLFKAIKFVQRHAPDEDDSAIGANEDNSRADQEWKSLGRVKSVRHPFILLLDRYENIENFLVIVMELADKTLADRFKECRQQGLPGIPREEMLGYMSEAAEVLDLMNSQYQLQHLDIKPQNLFLVHNHIKVADFGLVKDTTEGAKLMTITGGVTPVYAAPETFDGKFSRLSDQYSLAIVYQEMLTGYRPFTGTSMKQLILQHLQNAYDLTPAPMSDRGAIARALSKNPEDRFATCMDFVRHLRKSSVMIQPDLPGAAGASASGDRAFPSMPKTQGVRGAGGPIKPVKPNFSEEELLKSAPAPAGRRPPPVPSAPPQMPIEAPQAVKPREARRRRQAGEHAMSGLIQPSVVVGLGQLGIDTLAQLRERLVVELGTMDATPRIRMLAIDTDPATIQSATAGESRASLRTQDSMLARMQRPSHYLKSRDGKLPTDHWLSSKLLYRIPREQKGAGLRPLGRLAFVDNYRPIAKRLETELAACCSEETLHDSDPASDPGVRTLTPRVYIVTSLTGNSGSGMFLDIAYLARKLLNSQGHSDAEVVGVFFLPAARNEPAYAAALANAHASLLELQHYCQPDSCFTALYETAANLVKGEYVTEVGPAFQRCVLFNLPPNHPKRPTFENAPILARAGDFLCRDIATSLGPTIDEVRSAKIESSTQFREDNELTLQAIGLFRIHWPRHALLEQGARWLCSQLITRWMSKDAREIADTVQQWTHEHWDALAMRPENLIERFQELCALSIQQSPEQMLAEILAPLQQENGKSKSTVQLRPVVQCMDQLERAIGIPDEARSAKNVHTDPALLERALAEIAHIVADECEQRLAELAVTLLEDPNYRLAGAEEALRQFSGLVEKALSAQEVLATELSDRATQLGVRIQQLTESTAAPVKTSSSLWGSSTTRGTAVASKSLTANDLFELVRTYTKTRYHSLVLTHLNRLYTALRGHLSDQIREVGFCRQRLGELLGLVAPADAKSDANDTPIPGERALFPTGCLNLKDAVQRLIHEVSFEDQLQFDHRIQAWVVANYQALLHVCMGTSTQVRNLAPAMIHEAESFLMDRLQGESVAEMYLAQQRRRYEDDLDDQVIDDFERCLDDASPDLGRMLEKNGITLVTFPKGEHGQQLHDLVHERIPEIKTILTERQDEMLFYHETLNIRWKELDQLGPIAKEAYQRRLQSDPTGLHSRMDLAGLQPVGVDG
jgi:serine/threonine protein kinase